MSSENELESPLASHSPNGKICKTPPTSIPANTTVVIKKQKITSPAAPAESKHRIRVGDFDKLTKSLTEDCIADKDDNLKAVQLAWVEVCNNCDIEINIKDSAFKAVCRFY
jgi:hypothetical protein